MTPKTTDELIAALADGELELCQCPDLFAKLADDPECGRKLAEQKKLREAICGCLQDTEPFCPDALRAQIESMCAEDDQQAKSSNPSLASAPAQPKVPSAPSSISNPVLARIGRWVPAAVAAVLLLAAGILFSQASANSRGGDGPNALLTVSQVNQFAGRHGDCGMDPTILKDRDRFGDPESVQALPGHISDYFNRSADGMNLDLSRVGYRYQMTGACSLPSSGAIHLVYRKLGDPSKAMSLWLRPDDGSVAIEPGRLYVEAGDNLDHPVVLWKDNGMVYYLVGDSLEDTHKAVDALRSAV
ncbi:MAG: hypothetical protein AAGH88_03670 [Planctomycetota bacterium]